MGPGRSRRCIRSRMLPRCLRSRRRSGRRASTRHWSSVHPRAPPGRHRFRSAVASLRPPRPQLIRCSSDDQCSRHLRTRPGRRPIHSDSMRPRSRRSSRRRLPERHSAPSRPAPHCREFQRRLPTTAAQRGSDACARSRRSGALARTGGRGRMAAALAPWLGLLVSFSLCALVVHELGTSP